MPNALPVKCRIFTKKGFVPKLGFKDELVELCTCGHLAEDHRGTYHEGPCRICTCAAHDFKTYLIRRT